MGPGSWDPQVWPGSANLWSVGSLWDMQSGYHVAQGCSFQTLQVLVKAHSGEHSLCLRLVWLLFSPLARLCFHVVKHCRGSGVCLTESLVWFLSFRY